MIIYSSTNEQEGLPLFKLFEQATGIRVTYVRGADAMLMARMAIEFRGNQKAWDIAQTATINKMQPQLLLQFEPPEIPGPAEEVSAEAPAAVAAGEPGEEAPKIVSLDQFRKK